MARTLSPRGKENAQMQIRFVRYEEAPNYFKMDEELLYAYTKQIQIMIFNMHQIELYGKVKEKIVNMT